LPVLETRGFDLDGGRHARAVTPLAVQAEEET
jgi:hypothetical protein